MSTSTVKEVLIEARKRIEKGWTRNVFARDSMGNEVMPRAENAVCWCMAGALRAEAPNMAMYERAWEALRDIFSPENQLVSVVQYNDAFTRTQADILAIFDRAIAAQGDN